MSSQLILIVEENAGTRAFLADQLEADGYEVLLAEDRRHALALLASRQPHLVLADINGQTLGLLDAVRAGEGLAGDIDPHTPLIVLTARTGELERVRVFDRGGDDVVAKPFSYPELRGRIRALLRRAHQRPPARVSRVGTLTVNHLTREVRVGERSIELAAKEYELLQALIAEPTRVHTRQELLREVWGLNGQARTRTLDSHVISSPDMAVVYVDCGFCPTRGRRFISSGVVSALAAGLSPEGEAPWRGRCAPADHTPSSLDHGFLAHRPSRRAAGRAGGVDGARRRRRGGRAGGGVPAVSAPNRALAQHAPRVCA
jgi:DNA-binding response OmpR family regulator